MQNRRKLGLAVVISLPVAAAAQAGPTLTTLVSFNLANGEYPRADLTIDAAGNLYGTTNGGGTYYSANIGGGTIFELSGSNHLSFSTLANFDGVTNGQFLDGNLASDAAGNLYGTTVYGGTNNDGTVFELSGSNHQTLTTIESFSGTDANPRNSLAIDSAGNIYGTTSLRNQTGSTIFELSGSDHQTLTTLATFSGTPIYGGLAFDKNGNLYGTTVEGGNGNGSVFELSGTNHQTVKTLVAFTGHNDGEQPYDTLIFDAAGNIYGTTAGGISTYGSVFELSGLSHTIFSTLATFNGSNGQTPISDLLLDAAGNLFGTTQGVVPGIGPATVNGTVFELSGTNHQTLTTLVNFNGTTNANPDSGLVADADGNLYGTTGIGGTRNEGTVFELSGTGFVAPEPTGLSLLAIGGVALLRRRRIRG